MDVQTIQKNLQQQKIAEMFIVDIQQQQFGHLIIQKKNHTLYCGKYCMKRFCSCLGEHAANILTF